MTAFRSALFLLLSVIITIPMGFLVPLAGLFGYRAGCWTAKVYAAAVVHLARLCCGIRWHVEGMENVSGQPVVFMAKHQSAWETVFMQGHFPPQCWIVKKELLWLPFVGWGLLGIRCIPIDRSSGKSARDQIVEKGAARIAQGMCVSIFPEGTRIPVGKRGRYGLGGALLAAKTGTPIVPIAHNAGEYWGRYAFRKHAGTVRVIIGKPIVTAGRDAPSINAEVETWIEARMREMNPERYADA